MVYAQSSQADRVVVPTPPVWYTYRVVVPTPPVCCAHARRQNSWTESFNFSKATASRATGRDRPNAPFSLQSAGHSTVGTRRGCDAHGGLSLPKLTNSCRSGSPTACRSVSRSVWSGFSMCSNPGCGASSARFSRTRQATSRARYRAASERPPNNKVRPSCDLRRRVTMLATYTPGVGHAPSNTSIRRQVERRRHNPRPRRRRG